MRGALWAVVLLFVGGAAYPVQAAEGGRAGGEVGEPDGTGSVLILGNRPVAASASVPTSILLVADRLEVAEDDGPTSITVTASLVPSDVLQTDIDVNVSVAGTGDAERVDFAPVGDFVITIPRNTVSAGATFQLKPENDQLDEDDETLTLSGSASLPVMSLSLALTDDDPLPIGSVRALNRASEPGKLQFEVYLDKPSGREVKASYVTENANAIKKFGDHQPRRTLARLASPGTDFDSVSGRLTISPGQTSKTIEVNVHDDTLDEPIEIVVLSIAGFTNAAIVDGDTSTVSECRPWNACSVDEGVCCDCGLIDDDDPSVELTLHDAEASESAPSLVFPMRFSAPTEKWLKFTVNTKDGSAKASHDYRPRVNSFSWLRAGPPESRVPVTLFDDRIDEPDETFELTVSEPENQIVIADGTATGTIRDNDAPPRLSVAAVSGVEGSTLGFVVSTSTTSTGTITVNYGTSDGAAVAGQDYQAVQGTLTFAPGESSKTVSVTTIDDTLEEPVELFTLTLSSPANATLAAASAYGAIFDNDTPELSVTGVSGTEGGALGFVVSASVASVRTVTVYYKTSDDTAASGQDYQAAQGTLTFAPGETRRTVSVTTLDDALDEPAEVFALTLSAPTNATLDVASANGTILDDDAAPRLSVAGASGNEGKALDFVASVSPSSGRTISVNYATADGTAAAGRDYHAGQGTLTFAPGETSRTVSVTTLDDALDEPAETFALTLSSPANATLDVASAGGTIVDDDVPPQLSVAGASGDEGKALDFAVSLSSASGQTVTVNHAATDGTALAGQDYQAVQGTLTFAPGATSRIVSVATLDDAQDEPAETFTLTLSSPANATLAAAIAEGWILDDDAGPQLSVAGTSGDEGSALDFVVSASSTGGQTITVDYATTDGSAVSGQDYRAARGSLAFAPGESRKTVSVATLDDALTEGVETFALTLSSPADVDFGARTATGTIIDNDTARVVLTAAPASVPEGAGPTAVRVTAVLEGALRDVATLVRVSVLGAVRKSRWISRRCRTSRSRSPRRRQAAPARSRSPRWMTARRKRMRH